MPLLDIQGAMIPVLGEGHVRVVDAMGEQGAIVQAARVSYGAGTKTLREDRGLIRYLMRHRHSTPFEMVEIKLHLKMPIFVARQWHRHRTASINEYSARFSILDSGFYLPGVDDLCFQSSSNGQGSGDALDPKAARAIREEMRQDMEAMFDHYKENVRDVDVGGEGLAREMARITLPLATWTEFYWKLNGHNLLHFLSLRADPHAQPAIRAYAEAISRIVAAWMPAVWEAFEDYRLGAVTFSAPEMLALRDLILSLSESSSSPRPLVNHVMSVLEAHKLRDGEVVISEREAAAFLKAIRHG